MVEDSKQGAINTIAAKAQDIPLRLRPFLVASFIAQTIATAGVIAVPIVLSLSSVDAGAATLDIGRYVALLYLTAAISSLACGSRSIQVRRRAVLFWALVACGVGVMVADGGGNMRLLLSSLIVGIGYGPMTPLNSQIVAELTTSRRGLLLSLRQAGVPLGGMLAGAATPVLFAAGGASLVYSSLLVGCTVSGFAVARYCPPASMEHHGGSSKPGIGDTPFGSKHFGLPVMSLLIAAFIFGGAQMCLASYLVAYLISDHAVLAATAGAMLTAAASGGLVCRVIWGALSDAVHSPRLILVFNAVGITLTAILVGSGYSMLSPSAVWLACLLFGANVYGWNGIHLAAIADLVEGAQRGRILGISTFITFLGVVVWPPVFALLATRSHGMVIGFNMIAVLCLGVAALLACSVFIERTQ